MQIYPASFVFLAILALCATRGMHNVLLLAIAMMPFGMFAVVGLPSVGGLSLLAVNVTAAALVGLGCLALTSRLVRVGSVKIEPTTLPLVLFAAYAIFSTTVLVRLFEGETMVFALSRDAVGVKVSHFFSWGKVWLGPTSSNISQTFYVVLACGFFICATHVLNHRGAAFGARCLALAGTVNLVLGVLDLMQLDAALSVIRTASYALANEVSVQGMPRVIGGYSEAASFGSSSAMFFAYFASAYLHGRRAKDAAIALGNGIFTVLALSATGLIALAIIVCLLCVKAVSSIPGRIGRTDLLLGAYLIGFLAIGVAATLTLTEAPTMIASVVDRLIFQKSGSSSGMERTAWAIGGLEAMRDTWGLGAGAGSLRSNGLLFVLFGSVGVIGTTSFVLFLCLAFGGRAAQGQAAILSNTRIAALATMISMLLAATVPDPGAPLIFLAALAVSAKNRRAEAIETETSTHFPTQPSLRPLVENIERGRTA